MRRMKRLVIVTKADIAGGKRKDSDACPIALAASRAFRRPMSMGTFSITEINGPWGGTVPKRITEWVSSFDATLTVQPTRFMCHLDRS